MNATKTTPIQSTIDNATEVASWSNHNYEQSDQSRHQVRLYRARNGRYLLVAIGGMPFRTDTKWITPEAAWRFVAEHAMDPVSGYGFTDEETAKILAGNDDVRGTRECDGLLTPCPHLSDF
jgi:hypothetical protein